MNVDTIPPASYEKVVMVHPSSQLADNNVLVTVLRVLKTGGSLYLATPDHSAIDAGQSKSLVSALTLVGYIDIQASSDEPIITAAKPSYAVGTASKLSIPKRSASTSVTAPAAAALLQNLAIDMGNDDVIDESTLLDETVISKPSYDDCDTVDGARDVCKNCTCGRAEEEDTKKVVDRSELLRKIEEGTATSSCGSVCVK